MNINFLLSIIISLLIFICLYYSLSIISFSVYVGVCLIYWIIRYCCKYLVFQGSCSGFQNSYFFDYHQDILYQTIKILKVFRYLNDNSSQKELQNAKDYFTLQYQIFQHMKGILNQTQTTYSNLLSNLIELLQSSQNKELIKIQSKQIQKFLDSQVDSSRKPKYMKTYRLDMLFGTLEQFRQEILLTNPKASRHIIKFQENSIDCIHLANNQLDGPTVLLCNPNAGYYEILYKNCTWKQIYQTMNINIILWNYCEYGCSTGTLSPTNLVECGMFIAQSFQKKFNIKILGVHGVSLGGMVASEIAFKLKLSFLIADRTFSSLGQVAAKIQFQLLKYRFNIEILRILFNIVVNWDFPNYLSFYQFEGPKLIIQDANDQIIPYEAQLQTGVVRQFFTNQTYSLLHSYFNYESKYFLDFFFNQILPETQTLRLCKSLQMVIHNQSQHHQQFYQELEQLFSQIEYCQNQFLRVMDTRPTPEKIALFFGSCFMFDQHTYESINQIIVKIRGLLKQHYQQFNERQEHVELIVESINQIAKNFQYIKQIQELRKRKKRKPIDYLIAINCGHNENLSKKEEEKFQKILNLMLYRQYFNIQLLVDSFLRLDLIDNVDLNGFELLEQKEMVVDQL